MTKLRLKLGTLIAHNADPRYARGCNEGRFQVATEFWDRLSLTSILKVINCNGGVSYRLELYCYINQERRTNLLTWCRPLRWFSVRFSGLLPRKQSLCPVGDQQKKKNNWWWLGWWRRPRIIVTSKLMMRGSGWLVLAPPSIASPRIDFDLETITSISSSCSCTKV